uniref:Uncharacterized protein n=1 Tax=Anguilla anguilla TaxID=7936 RepID=A0A0E9W0M1_ANGAN
MTAACVQLYYQFNSQLNDGDTRVKRPCEMFH